MGSIIKCRKVLYLSQNSDTSVIQFFFLLFSFCMYLILLFLEKKMKVRPIL